MQEKKQLKEDEFLSIKCSNCGRTCYSVDDICYYCGAKLEKMDSKPHAKILKKFIGMTMIALAVVLLIWIPKEIDNRKYTMAIGAAEEGKDTLARELFSELQNKKSEEVFMFCADFIDVLCGEEEYTRAYNWLQYIDKQANAEHKSEILRYCLDTINKLRDKDKYTEAFTWLEYAERHISEEEAKEIKKDLLYHRGDYYAKTGDYGRAYNQFDDLRVLSYKDSEEKRNAVWNNNKEYFYQIALSAYAEQTEDRYNYARSLFIKLNDYKDSRIYLQKIQCLNSMVGTYEEKSYFTYNRYHVIDYKYMKTYEEGDSTLTKIISVEKHGEKFGIWARNEGSDMGLFIYESDDGGTYYHLALQTKTGEIEFITDRGSNIRIYHKSSDTSPVSSPCVGMSRVQLERSTWGKPKKINESIYSWGTTEQWVYEGYRYVYVENGVVTSIQK